MTERLVVRPSAEVLLHTATVECKGDHHAGGRRYMELLELHGYMPEGSVERYYGTPEKPQRQCWHDGGPCTGTSACCNGGAS